MLLDAKHIAILRRGRVPAAELIAMECARNCRWTYCHLKRACVSAAKLIAMERARVPAAAGSSSLKTAIHADVLGAVEEQHRLANTQTHNSII